MKERIIHLKQLSQYKNAVRWGKTISLTGGAQVIVQGLSLLSGILIIRLMPTKEYALYTIANAMLGTLSLLSDGGISTGVMAEGGKVWNDKESLGSVVATGLNLRKKFAGYACATVIPVLLYLLIRNQAGWLQAILITLALIPAFLAALTDSIYEIIPKLHQDLKALQANQVTVSLARLLLTVLLLLIFPFSAIAILASGLPRIWGNIKLKKIAGKFASQEAKPDPQVKSTIIQITKRVLPGAVYFCISGQLMVWLISFFGKNSEIAQVGALGRLTMALSLISVVFSTVIVPRYARLQAVRELLLHKLFQVLFLMMAISVAVLGICYFFADQILWVLGPAYSNLQQELLYSILGSLIMMIWGTVFTLYSSRGWIIKPVISLSINISAIIIGLFLFKVDSLKGVLLFYIFTGIVELSLHLTYAFLKINQLKSVRTE